MNQGYEPKQDKPGTEYIPPNRGSGEVNKEQLPVCIHYKNGSQFGKLIKIMIGGLSEKATLLL